MGIPLFEWGGFMSAAQNHAAAILAAANNQLTPEQSRKIFLSLSALEMTARNSEHYAFLMMAATEEKRPRDAADFQIELRKQLKTLHEHLKFVSSILAGDK